VALIYYALVQYIKVKTRCKESLRELTRKIKSTLFERVHLLAILGNSTKRIEEIVAAPPDLGLFSV
jgi:predicted nuclease of restriction endonuclease-like (RecB) superfamily